MFKIHVKNIFNIYLVITFIYSIAIGNLTTAKAQDSIQNFATLKSESSICFKLDLVVMSGFGTLTAITPENCDSGYLKGTFVELAAHPASGYALQSWEGSTNDNTNELNNDVYISSDKQVKVIFKAVDQNHQPNGGDINERVVELANIIYVQGINSQSVPNSLQDQEDLFMDELTELYTLLKDPSLTNETRLKVKNIIALAEPSSWIDYTELDYLNDNPGATEFNFIVKYAPSSDLTHSPPQGDFDSDGVPDYVENVARYAEHARIQFGYFGFRLPGDITIKIYDLPSSAGETCASWCDILIDNRLDTSDKLKTTTIHELFHQIQFLYNAGYLTSDNTNWVYEGTAKWMEDVLFDDLNMNYDRGYVEWVNEKLHHLEDTITLHGTNEVSYRGVLFWKYFSEQFGSDGAGYTIDPFFSSIGHTVDPRGVDVIKELWEELDWTSPLDTTWIAEVDNVLSSHSTTWSSAFKNWCIANYLKKYRDNGGIDIYDYLEDEIAHYNPAMPSDITDINASHLNDQFSNDLVPWSARYYEFLLGDEGNDIESITINFDGENSGYWNPYTVYSLAIMRIDENNRLYGDVIYPFVNEYSGGVFYQQTILNDNLGKIVVAVIGMDHGGAFNLQVNGQEFPPAIISTNQSGVLNTSVFVTFNKDMNESTFTNSTVVVAGSSTGMHTNTFSFDHSTHVLTINPNNDFSYGETVYVTIGTGVRDLAGNSLASPYLFSFQVDNLPSYKLIGYVYQGTSGLEGVWVSDGYRGDYTNSSGYYEITGVPNDWYTVTPAKAGYTFNPTTSSPIHIENANRTVDPFYATPTGGEGGVYYPVADTFISMKEQYIRYGAYPRLYIGRNPIDNAYQEDLGLIRFNLSSLTGKTVASASLEIYFDEDGGNSLSINIHKMLDSWDEDIRYSEWNHQYSYASESEPVSDSGWETWESSTLKGWVQEWIDNPNTNYGLFLRSTSSYLIKHGWVSKEGNQAYWPRLVLTFYNYDEQADLTVSSPEPVGVTPPFQIGQTVNWRVVSTNHGPGDAPRNDVGYYLGTTPYDYSRRIGDDRIGPVVAGDNMDDQDFTYTFQETGTWYLNVYVDDDNGDGYPGEVAETNENNNKNSFGPFSVVAPNQTPEISGLPDQTLNEDDARDNAIDLWTYANDAETADAGLIFSLDTTPPAESNIRLDGNRYIDILPVSNWCGEVDITIRVNDPQGLFSTDTFHVSIACVNDLPWIAPPVTDQSADIGVSISIDLTANEHDIEDSGTALDWSVTGQENCTVSGENSDSDLLSFSPTSGFSGTDTVILHLWDSNGGEAVQEVNLTWNPLMPPPNAPTDLTLSPVSQTQIDLSWTDNSIDENDFHIERSPDGTSEWSEITTLAANTTNYSDTELTCGTPYYYRVRAQRHSDNQYSAFSNVANSTTETCTPPGSFGKVSPSNGLANQPLSPTLSWQSTSPVTLYEYCFDTSDDGTCTNWIENGTNTAVTLPTQSYNTTIYWQVRARNNTGGPTYADGDISAFWTFTTIPDPAVTFTVNSTADAVDASPGNGVCATSTNECTLRAAVQEANNSTGMNWIVLPAGTYNLTLTGTDEDASATGDLDITDSLTIIGDGQAFTIVDANDIDRVFEIPSPSSTVEIRNITIQNGTAPDIGGGILTRTTLTLTNVRVTANTAVAGAGIFHGGTVQNYLLTLVNSVIDSNQATGNGGGIAGYQSSITLQNTEINQNSALNGGGVYIDNTRAILTLDGAILNNNSATNGGGIYAYNSAVNIVDSQIIGNHASQDGGGIRCYQNVLSITGNTDIGVIGNGNIADDNNDNIGVGGGIYAYQCPIQITGFGNSIAGNSSAGGGGLYIYNSQGGSSSIENTVITGNQVHYSTGGGGIFNNSQISLENVTISGNTSWYGGGIGNYNTYANMLLTNVTITNNTATSNASDGISHTTGAVLQLENTIIANNNGSGCNGTGTITSLGHNLSSDSTCNLTDSTDQVNSNPLLGTLSDNGGLTFTHALSPGSPAIDTANPATCPSTDQRGINRPIDGDNDTSAVCDIGAYEAPVIVCAVPNPPALSSPANNDTISDNTPLFDWLVASSANEYQLQVDDNSDFTSPFIDLSTTTSDYTAPTAISDGSFYWRVRGHNTTTYCNLFGYWSPTWVFTIARPEIDVRGNSVSIPSGDTTPSTTDHTDFGEVPAGGTDERTFTIYNAGNGSLTLSGTPMVAVSGTNASDFTVSVQPTSPVAAGGSTTFTVVFDPSSTGVRTATISITNNDADEGSYSFNIQGTGIANPIPMITNLSPSSADAGGSAFTLTVNGSNFVADSKVRWNGTDSSTTYVSSTQLTASISTADIATAGTASVTVFNPAPGGGTSDEKIFTINPVVAYPEMDVKGNNISIPSGDTTPSISDHTEFDVAPVGGTAERTFTVFNTGNADLILSSNPVISFSGEHASDFSVKTSPNSLVVAGGSTTFTILFTPGAVGVRTATISIGNNDADENPYTFAIQGTGIGSPMPFGKINPNNNASNQLTDITLEWGNSSNATLYEYCIETDNDGDCDTIWRSAGMDNSAGVSGLSPLTTYYWQVRADNDYDPTEADGGVWWAFTTGNVTGQWINTTVLNTSRYLHAMTAWGNFVYALGGQGSGALQLSSIERAPINPDGTLGTWVTIGDLTSARQGHKVVVVDGYIYVVGGFDGTTTLNTVEFAVINPDGSLGPWQATNTLITARTHLSLVHFNNRLYAIGGSAGSTAWNSVEYAPILEDGSLGIWQQSSTSLSIERRAMDAVVVDGYIYVPMGNNINGKLSSVEYAQIQPDGTLSSWQTTTAAGTAKNYFSGLTDGKIVYAVGGTDTENNIVETSKTSMIKMDYTLDTWQVGANLIQKKYGMGSVSTKGSLYVSAGYGTASNYLKTVEYYHSAYYVPIEADFSATPLSGIVPYDVAFTNQSSGAYDTCIWDYGDGTISKDCFDPVHTYETPGVYTVTLTVQGLGDEDSLTQTGLISVFAPPEAANDSYSTDEDTPNTVAAPGVLDNDTDAESDPLTAIKVTDPAHGTLTLNSDGSFTYTPEANWSGTDSFTYMANDGTADSNTATVSINVTAVNDVPVANAQSVSTAEDTAKAITLTAIDPDDTTFTWTIVTAPAHGALSGTTPNVTYTPAANYNGTDSFTFKVNDGDADSNNATISISVTAVNDVPVANAQTINTAEDTGKGITLTATDPDDTSFTWTIVTPPTHGTLSGTAPNVTYTPSANYNGADSFTFKVNDGDADSNTTTVTLTITAVNDVPVAYAQSINTAEDTGKAITLTATDLDDTTFTWTIVAAPTHGAISGTAPNVTYTPSANYSGADSFTFMVNDGDADSNIATVTITVTAVNDVPVANTQSVNTTEDTAKVITLTATDPDDTSFTWTIVTMPAHGSLSGTAPNITYTPAANYSGADSFTFKVNDGDADSNTATVSITVTAVNDVPVANDQSVNTLEDVTKAITLTATDPDDTTFTWTIVTPPTNGSLTGTAPNITYTPLANYNGADSFTFKVNDGDADSNNATVTIIVTGINAPPVAVNESYTTAEDTPKTVAAPGVLGNDADVDGNPLTAIKVTDPTHGTLTLNTNGSFTYTPNANYNGTDSFTYKANDGTADSNVATVNLTITAVNDAPVANDQNVSTSEDTAKSITLTASDVDGNSLTWTIVSNPAHGTLSGTAPNLTYTPSSNWSGTDAFTFKANDGTVDSNIATVTINVAAINDPPVANNQTISATEDTAKAITLTASDVEGSIPSWTIISSPSHGSLTGTAPNLTYTPVTNWNGTDTFTFKVNDGLVDSNTATVTINVTVVNDTPAAANDSYSTNEDTPKTVSAPGVLSNDTDADGNPLTAIKVTNPLHGTVTLNSNGSFTYTPAANWHGSDSFTYKANDGTTDSNVVTVTLNVTAVNDPPVAVNDSTTTAEDTPKIVTAPGVLGNDTDADGSALTAIKVTDPAHGTVTLNANGSFTYIPNANYNGADSFTYKANDGGADSNVATVSVNVTAVNDPPVAVNNSYSTTEDTPKTVAAPGVLSNDTDADGDPLTAIKVTDPAHGTVTLNTNGSFTYAPAANWSGTDSFTYKANDGTADSNMASVNLNVTAVNDPPVANNQTVTTSEDTAKSTTIAATDAENDPLNWTIISNPAHGTLSDTAPDLSYTPTANWNGTDTFTFKVNDGTSDSNTATITINVTPINDAPVALNNGYTTNEDTPKTVQAPGVLGNDTDVDGDALTAIIVTSPTHGTLSFNANGSFTYTPNANWNGADSFTYKANDGTVDSNEAAVTLTVNAINDPPVADNQSVNTTQDTPKAITLTGSDIEGSTLTWTIVANPAHGALSGTAPNVIYTPTSGWHGSDSFTFKVNDGTVDSNIATVTILVTAANAPPVALNDDYNMDEDTTLNVAAPGVLSNDTDAESNPLTAILVTGPAHGTLTLNSNGSFTYIPYENWNGTDSFMYTAYDGSDESNLATVTITVADVSETRHIYLPLIYK